MSGFIDDSEYQFIMHEMRNLNINEISQTQSHFIEQVFAFRKQIYVRLERFKQLIQQKYTKKGYINFDLYNVSSKNLINSANLGFPDTDHIQAFMQNQFQNCSTNINLNINYSLYTKIIVKSSLCQFKISSIILRNGVPIQIKSKPFRLLLGRFFNKLNSSSRDGTFRINPFTGYLFYEMSSHLSLKQFNWFIVFDFRGMEYIECDLKSLILQMKQNFYKILVVMEQAPELGQKSSENRKQGSGRIHYKSLQHLETIKKCIQYSSFEYEFMYNNQIKKNFTENEIKNKIENAKKRFEENYNRNFILNNKNQLNKITEILNYYNLKDNFKKNFTYSNSFYLIKDFEKQFIRNLIYPIQKLSNTNEKMNIYNEIFIDYRQKIKWEIIAEGGFSRIEKAQCKFIYSSLYTNLIQNNNNKEEIIKKLLDTNGIKRVLARKTDKVPSIRKITEQKKIISIIKDMISYNVCKFYESTQQEYKNTLLMDFFGYKSLDNYRKTNTETFGIVTKLFLLAQAVQGIRFLTDYKILHLDIKPPNLLIGRNLIIRVTDFGESYHPQTRTKEFRPGYTLPYASPQIFSQNVSFHQSMDVFSIGILIHELLFDFFPLDIRRISQQKIINFYKQRNFEQLFLSNPQKIEGLGPKAVINLLCALSLKCLSKNINERPLLDWIQIILKECIQYLDQMY